MKSKKLLITIIALIFIVIGTAAGLIYYFMQKETAPLPKPTHRQQQENTQEQKLSQIGPLYKLAPFRHTFRNSGTPTTTLFVTFSLELNNKLLLNELNAKNKTIRKKILYILSSKNINNIITMAGKAALCKEIKKQLNPLLSDGKIKNIYIVNFLIS